jgi:glutaredoxin
MKRIVLYSMDKCPHCLTAKKYLEAQKIPFRLCNVQTPKGQKELAATGFRSVPVLKIGDQILKGFSVESFLKLLKK